MGVLQTWSNLKILLYLFISVYVSVWGCIDATVHMERLEELNSGHQAWQQLPLLDAAISTVPNLIYVIPNMCPEPAKLTISPNHYRNQRLIQNFITGLSPVVSSQYNSQWASLKYKTFATPAQNPALTLHDTRGKATILQ